MTDTQIFTFLVMPFLLVLTCSRVFFSSREIKSRKPTDPLASITGSNAYVRKPRNQSASAKRTGMTED
jgi:hypothetical protein